MNSTMKQKTVTTNLRIPADEWANVRSLASRLGVRSNEYLKRAVRLSINRDQLTSTSELKFKKEKPYQPLDEFLATAKSVPSKPMGASDDDKIIYGIED